MDIKEIDTKKSEISRDISQLRESRQLRLESLAEYLSTQGPPDEMTDDLKSYLWLITNTTTEIAWKVEERNKLNELRRELRKPYKLASHVNCHIAICQDEDEENVYYLYCGSCDVDLFSEEVAQ